jgi:nucleoside-diphosphate-sugar epimerase
LLPHANFRFTRGSLEDRVALGDAFAAFEPQRVVNLAAQAGVRYSLENPQAYVDSNVVGFLNILEACRHRHTEHLVYASSSSVYGANRKLPFSVDDSVDHPVSMYAATKKANELMAHTYSHLFGLPTTGSALLYRLRTMGPTGHGAVPVHPQDPRRRADRRLQPGRHSRDFTYIDDIVEGVVRTLDRIPVPTRTMTEWRPRQPARVRPIGSTTSATTSRWNCCCVTSRSWSTVWDARPNGVAADAAGRRARYLGRRRGPAPGCRLFALHPDRGRGGAIRRLVPRISRGVRNDLLP